MKVTAHQFKKFSDLVYREVGINLHEGKEQLLNARLAKRLRRTGIDSAEEYLGVLKKDGREMIAFLDAISTNHTYFFRESQHFEHLAKEHLQIWCAACSSGEEPYSIAMYCMDKGFSPSILATDISTNVLRVAQQGIYALERTRSTPPHILKKYFQKGYGRSEGYVRIKDAAKRTVEFGRFNLLTDSPPARQFDVIFCRNVMIYFDNPTKEKVIDNLNSVLKPGGLFIIGGAESLSNLTHKLKYVRPSVYRKVAR
jgi:chemotaxis protein methyltransferase CheR